MLNIPSSLKRSVTGKVVKIATLWDIRRKDGTNFFFTDHDRQIEFEGNVYLPSSQATTSAVQRQPNLNPNNLEVVGYITNDAITDTDLRLGLFRDADVIERMVDWRKPWAGALYTANWTIGEAKFTSETWEVQIRDLAYRLSQKVGRIADRGCQHELGDAICRVNIPSLTVAASITTVVESRRTFFTSIFAGVGNGYYNNGIITFTSGLNNGVKRMIKDHTEADGKIELYTRTDKAVAVSDTFTLSPGCDYEKTTCIGRFANLVNFGGFSYIPGNDRMTETPR
jgi:uncharacterized phage protein (TIGR02218 family)